MIRTYDGVKYLVLLPYSKQKGIVKELQRLNRTVGRERRNVEAAEAEVEKDRSAGHDLSALYGKVDAANVALEEFGDNAEARTQEMLTKVLRVKSQILNPEDPEGATIDWDGDVGSLPADHVLLLVTAIMNPLQDSPT